MKKIKPLKSKILFARKKKLIELIEKSDVESIRGFEQSLPYQHFFKKDFDFDYSYLIWLIKIKLERMSRYFHSHGYTEDSEKCARQIDRTTKVIGRLLDDDTPLDEMKINLNTGIKYVPKDLAEKWTETRNGRTVFKENTPPFKKYIIHNIIKEEKSWHLIWKMLDFYCRFWWD